MSIQLYFHYIFIFTFARYTFSQEYNVRDFGAVGDGITDDTLAIQTALQAANKSNGGRVTFDFGYIFLMGGFHIPSNTILDVRGKILALNESYDYPGPIITAHYANNITVTGGGVIDGQGNTGWWKCPSDTEEGCVNKTRPPLVHFNRTTDLVIFNLTIQNSPFYNIAFLHVNRAHIYNVMIVNPPGWYPDNGNHTKSYNTDGVNIFVSSNILIENSYISTGDDGIAIFSITNELTDNITVRNMTIGGSYGMCVITLTGGEIRNITFDNIFMNGSRDGVQVKGQRGKEGSIHNVTYSNFHVYNSKWCIYMTLNYLELNKSATNESLTPRIYDINIQDDTKKRHFLIFVYRNSEYGWNLEGLNDSYINANFYNINIKNTSIGFSQRCTDIYGNCDSASVFPSCPSCIGPSCEDTSNDCQNYLGQCNNAAYHDLLCSLCRKTCNLCNLCI